MPTRPRAATVQRGGRRELDLYAAPAEAIPGELGAWKKIVDADRSEAVAFDVHGDDLYLLTHHEAPRFKIVRTSLAHPFTLHPAAVVPEGEAVITAFGAARDALYLTLQRPDGARAELRRIPWKGGSGGLVPLPFEGTIPAMFVQPFAPGVLFQLGSPTSTPRVYAFGPRDHAASDTQLFPPSPAAPPALATDDLEARSADGTAVPLTVVRRADLVRDGSHPAWLRVEAASGALLDPTFTPTRLAWLERGGVFAFCHARGGGERGERWHEAATRENKPRSIEDLLACAEALASAKLSGPGRLAAEGEGAGGLVVAGAVVRRPALFGAAVIRDGLVNPLRLGETPAGALWAAELGTAKTEAGWRALFAVDAYGQIERGARYPAVLLEARRSDPLFPPWQSAKLAARLRAATGSGKAVLLRPIEGESEGKAREDERLADEMAFVIAALEGE